MVDEDKERIVTESYSGHDSVSRIARRHGLLPQQLFSWRREARRTAVAGRLLRRWRWRHGNGPPDTKPATLPAKASRVRSDRPKAGPAVTMMEIEAGGIKVRVLRGADSAMVAAIVRALKAAS